MDGDSHIPASHGSIPWFTRPQQRLIALLVVTAQLGIAGWWLAHGGMRGGLIRLDEARPRECPSRFDINQCGWPELTLLPGISETMARRIVQHREEHGRFQQLDDLQRVRGIGPKKLARLRPYLVCRARADGATEKP